MADQNDPFPTREPLPPELEPLHRRLLDDGALWRARLPSTERLEQRLKSLAQQERRARLAAPARKLPDRFRLIHRMKGKQDMLRGRLKTALAVATIATVVVLFVVLFHGFIAGRGAQTGQPSNTSASPSSRPGQFTSYAGLSNLKGLPEIAPSNPQVVYLLTTDSSDQLKLARTENEGKSWQTFALPAGKASDQFPPTFFVSPLDAHTVFLTVGGTRSGSTCVVSRALGSYTTLSGGGNLCALQYVSKDGGAHWSQVQFPASGIVGDTIILDEAIGQVNENNVLRPQGNRLYAAFGPYSQYNQLEGEAGARLVVSNDGGSTWQFIDNGLTGAGYICDIVPVPAGSTVFAITSDISCSAGGGESLTLWRSDNAGADWSQVGPLPGNTDQGMVAVSDGNGGQPLLYINAPTRQGGGYLASTRPRTGNGALVESPADLQVSIDGGKTWHSAPTQGFPDASANPGLPLGVLSDGSVVFAAIVGQPGSPAPAFYAWKSGDASWRKLTPNLPAALLSALVTSAADGKQTLWIVVSTSSKTYSIQSFQL